MSNVEQEKSTNDCASKAALANAAQLTPAKKGDKGVVLSVNLSEKKGTRKTPVAEGVGEMVYDFGFKDDAHAGDWHRQVSLLARESIDKAVAAGLDVTEGDFGENITTQGVNILTLPMGSLVRVGDTELEISQIGKVCHTRCAIYYLAGDCIFPREGVFGVVRKPGMVHVGDEVEVLEIGDGHCARTPQSALDEFEEARRREEAGEIDENQEKAEKVRAALAACKKIKAGDQLED